MLRHILTTKYHYLARVPVRGAKCTEDIMPDYEIRYLTSEGELALIHKTHQLDDEAVDLTALRMLMGSGLSRYEIWRTDEDIEHRAVKTVQQD